MTLVVAKQSGQNTVAVAEEHDVLAAYLIVTVGGTAHPDVARAFVDLVRGPVGQAILADHGFLPAP